MRAGHVLAAAAALLILAACSGNPGPSGEEDPLAFFAGLESGFLKPSNIPSQFFTVDTGKDFSVTLKQGTIIRIPAGSIRSSVNPVRLEAKEIQTMNQMVMAGLTTQTNGEPLSSGGMTYLAPAAGMQARIVKEVQLSVPTQDAKNGMQHYTGTLKDGKLDWQDPRPLTIAKATQQIDGERLFKRNCESCHNLLKDATGPKLYGAPSRWESKQKMYAWVRNSGAMIASGDPYANCLYEHWKANMTGFPNLTDRELDALFAYTEAAGRAALGKDTAKILRYSHDSCAARKQRLKLLEQQAGVLRNQRRPAMSEVDYGTATSPMPATPASAGRVANPPAPDTMLDSTAPPDAYASDYYTISITAFGWHNIDVLLGNLPGIIPANLRVTLSGQLPEKPMLLLVIPGVKVMMEGTRSKEGNDYFFKFRDGNLPLPQGARVYLLAMGEDASKKQLYCGVESFVATGSHRPVVRVAGTDSAGFRRSIASLGMEGLSAVAKENKVPQELKMAEQEAQALWRDMQAYCPCEGSEERRMDDGSGDREYLVVPDGK